MNKALDEYPTAHKTNVVKTSEPEAVQALEDNNLTIAERYNGSLDALEEIL